MPSSFKIDKPHAHLERNGFDLSNTEIFSAKAGQLLPIKCIPVVPGDEFKLNVKSLVRTMPLNSAAFVNMKCRFDFFFVSYQSLWHNWDNFITQRDDRTSSNLRGYKYAPTFSRNAISAGMKVVGNDGISANPKPSSFDLHGFLISDDAVRLFDLLGYGVCGTSNGGKNVARYPAPILSGDQYLSLFPILGYNKIYFDYYANPYYESIDPTLFNVDDLDCSTSSGSHLRIPEAGAFAGSRACNMWQIRYAPFMKDYFTSLLPNQQFGSVSIVNVNGTSSSLLGQNFVMSNVNGGEVVNNAHVIVRNGRVMIGDNNTPRNYDSAFTNVPSYNISSSFDILSLRMAEQLQRWKESTMRAGYRTKDQYEAHFGVKPNDYRAEHVQFLGSNSCSIGIDEVLTTANTSDVDRSTTGDIYGKGIGAVNGNDIRFHATEWGQIMCIMSILPQGYYDGSFMLSRNNSFSDPFDFYTPEFAKIGLDAVYSYEFLQNGLAPQNHVFGYTNRYASYQTAVDKTHGTLCSGQSLSYWTAPRTNVFSDPDGDVFTNVTPRFLHYNPKYLNSLFTVAADSTQETDQFIFESNFNIFAVRPMPKLSLPNII